MCYHSKQTHEAQELENRFNAKIDDFESFHTSAHYNGFGHPSTPIITDNDQKLIQHFQWGLIPFWAKDTKIQKSTLNAKIETLTEKPSYRNSVNKRCLVIADGFFEWQWLDPKGKQKQKYLITLPDNGLFAFGGIYSEWTNKSTGEIINSYSIVTTAANELMSEIHNTKKRMPVILTKENEKDWLNDTPILDFQDIDPELKAIEI